MLQIKQKTQPWQQQSRLFPRILLTFVDVSKRKNIIPICIYPHFFRTFATVFQNTLSYYDPQQAIDVLNPENVLTQLGRSKTILNQSKLPLMGKLKSDILHVQGIDVGIYTEDYCNEYISLTDIARFRNSDDPRFAIQNWMRNRNTIEFLGLWESLHNPGFNRVQFDTFRTVFRSYPIAN